MFMGDYNCYILLAGREVKLYHNYSFEVLYKLVQISMYMLQ